MRVVLVALLLAAPAQAGPCAIPALQPRALTADAATIAKGGGVIVALTTSFTDDKSSGDATAWRFRDGKQRVTPTLVTLAPGLMVLQLPASGGDAQVLENAAKIEQVAVRRGAAANLLAAPRVRKASAQQVPGGRFGASDEVVLELIAAPPTEALGVVLFGIDAKQATTARSWTTVDHDGLAWVVYHSGNRCSSQIPGTLPSSIGDHVAFAWVDRSGRLSTMSAEVVVARR